MKSVKLSYLDVVFEISAESTRSLLDVLQHLGNLSYDAYELAENQGYKYSAKSNLHFANMFFSKCNDLIGE